MKPSDIRSISPEARARAAKAEEWAQIEKMAPQERIEHLKQARRQPQQRQELNPPRQEPKPEHSYPCTKVRFPSGGKARAAVDRIRERGERRSSGTKPIRVHVCPHCQGWHLTSSPD